MTAMLTLRRADPCNRGAGGEQLLTDLLCSCFSPPPSPSPPSVGKGHHGTLPSPAGAKSGRQKAREGQSQEVCVWCYCCKLCWWSCLTPSPCS